MHSETSVRRVVSFSPEKRRLLQTVENATDEGCEIKKSKISSSNDIIINQYSAIKKIKPTFPKTFHEVPVSTLSEVINELPLYKRVTVSGMVYNISSELTDEKKGKTFTYKKATLKDNTDSLTVQFLKPYSSELQEKKCYKLNHMMICIYEQEKYLRTTQVSTIVEADIEVAPPSENVIEEVNYFLL